MPTPPLSKDRPKSPKSLADWKWATIIALPIVLILPLMGFYSVWGILFIYWAVHSITSGSAFFVEPLEREETPLLFWIITLMWVFFGVLYIIYDLYPEGSY